ncbi:Odorant receptor 9 [Blattella germanica]|nr:Odorant receptor 9 [Blattella germanica]
MTATSFSSENKQLYILNVKILTSKLNNQEFDHFFLKFTEKMEGTKRLRLLHLQLIALYLSGILYPPNWEQNRCKKFIYDIFTFITIIWFPPTIFLQMIFLLDCLGDLRTATGILFQVSCYISTYIIFLYFVWHRKALVKLIDRIETEFVFHLERVGTPSRRDAILAEDYRKQKIITCLMLGLCFLVEAAWGVIPGMIGYIEYFIKTEEELANNEKGKYFGLAIWLPDNVNKSPTYEMVHCFHFIAVYTVVSNITACYMTMFMFAYHTTTIFKLTCAAFEDADDFENTLLVENESNHDIRLMVGSSSSKETMRSYLNSMAANRWNEHSDRMLDKKSKEDNNHGFTSNELQTSNFNSTVSTGDDVDVSHQKMFNEDLKRSMQKYLENCISFHQAIIQYTSDLNELLSPVMLVFFVFSEAMMCLSTFQLALGKMDEKKFKFLWSVLLASVWPLLVCLYGDDLMSIAVKQSVFNTRWFCQTTAYNKLVLMVMMRAELPICLRAGKFYIATLQTFADIGHKVYAYFTLLRQMYDD